MKRSFRWLIPGLVLLLSACNPLDVRPQVKCDDNSRVCTVTVTNNENRKVKYSLQVGYEPQGAEITPVYNPLYQNEERFDHWVRQVAYFFTTGGDLAPHESATFTATMPKEFFNTPGQSLVDAFLQVDPPNGFSSAYGLYHSYATVSVPGNYDRPIRYTIACNRERAEITIINTGKWGDRQIALYLNGDLEKVWQLFTVKAGDTLTFTTDPIPEGTYLIEADVHGHREQVSFGKIDYHGARAYCVPQQ